MNATTIVLSQALLSDRRQWRINSRVLEIIEALPPPSTIQLALRSHIIALSTFTVHSRILAAASSVYGPQFPLSDCLDPEAATVAPSLGRTDGGGTTHADFRVNLDFRQKVTITYPPPSVAR